MSNAVAVANEMHKGASFETSKPGEGEGVRYPKSRGNTVGWVNFVRDRGGRDEVHKPVNIADVI